MRDDDDGSRPSSRIHDDYEIFISIHNEHNEGQDTHATKESEALVESGIWDTRRRIRRPPPKTSAVDESFVNRRKLRRLTKVIVKVEIPF